MPFLLTTNLNPKRSGTFSPKKETRKKMTREHLLRNRPNQMMHLGVKQLTVAWLYLTGIRTTAAHLFSQTLTLETSPPAIGTIGSSPPRPVPTCVEWTGSSHGRRVAEEVLLTWVWTTNEARAVISTEIRNRQTGTAATSNTGCLRGNETTTCLGEPIDTQIDHRGVEEREKETGHLVITIRLETILSEIRPGITRWETLLEIIPSESTLVITPPGSSHVIMSCVSPHVIRVSLHVIIVTHHVIRVTLVIRENLGIDGTWRLFSIGTVGVVLITPLHLSTWTSSKTLDTTLTIASLVRIRHWTNAPMPDLRTSNPWYLTPYLTYKVGILLSSYQMSRSIFLFRTLRNFEVFIRKFIKLRIFLFSCCKIKFIEV